jgi:hypothetical protein
MRRHAPVLSAIIVTCSVAFLAAQPSGVPSRLIVSSTLAGPEVGQLLSASDRMVWDRQSGAVVAEVPEANVPSLPEALSSTASCAGPEAFAEALKAALPEFSAEAGTGERYVTKEPVALVKPTKAPNRPEHLAKDRVAGQLEDLCLSENFETIPIWYEDGGLWWHYQGGQPDNAVGDYYWLDTSCDAFDGNWGCEAIMGGTYGSSLPCDSTYDYSTDSWLEFAPWITCLAGAPGAYLDFYGKVYTQTGLDYFYYLVSVDGQNYLGYKISGSLYNTWYNYNQNMRAWSGLGDLTVQPHLALAFVFQSGRDIPQSFTGFGVRLDKISIVTTSMSISSVSKMGSPFRLSLTGGGFLPGAWVYINGASVPGVAFKGPSNLKVKGGAALKAMLPKGQPVCITVVNPNGGTTPCYTYTR